MTMFGAKQIFYMDFYLYFICSTVYQRLDKHKVRILIKDAHGHISEGRVSIINDRLNIQNYLGNPEM